MTTVIRVKRKVNEEPLSAFILNCKKRKIDDKDSTNENFLESKDEVSTILKLAGTIKSRNENISSQITKLSKKEANEIVTKIRKPNITEKKRKENNEIKQENRFKVVNCFRTIQEENEKESLEEIIVVDVEKQDDEINAKLSNEIDNTQQNTSLNNVNSDLMHSDDNFVFDLYFIETNNENDINVDYSDSNNISVRPFDDLVYEDRCGYNDSDEENYLNDSEDSNAEDYWTNDYPDTDDDDSIKESDMRRAVNNFYLDDNDLSSDDEDNYAYSIDLEDSEDNINYNEHCEF